MAKKGEWLNKNPRPKSMVFVCSECKNIAYYPQGNVEKEGRKCGYKYCPYCGIEMEL